MRERILSQKEGKVTTKNSRGRLARKEEGVGKNPFQGGDVHTRGKKIAGSPEGESQDENPVKKIMGGSSYNPK